MAIERTRTLSERLSSRGFLRNPTARGELHTPLGLLARPYLHDRRCQPRVYGRVGDLEVRMASSLKDIRLAQRMRYKVFYKEMSATPSLLAELRRRDEDPYDAICDHLLVVDRAAAPQWQASRRPLVIGTYRLLSQDVALRHFGFFTLGENDIAPLLERHSS